MQALRHLVTHPDATLDDLMRFVPGPDLPTGGMIVGLDGVRDAYETGRGTFRMRATARVESVGRRKGIVVTELPYGVGTEKVSERIKSLVQAKKLQGIADIKDLTDREHGLRLVIEVKNGFVPEALLEQLYKQTPMEDTFGINAVALVDGQPRTLGLKHMLEVFLGHRFDVVRRRSAHRRTKAADRLHLVEGLLVAILDIDEVIQLIRSSDNSAEAKERLIGVFDLTSTQADYILDMPLRRLTKFSKLELDKEKAELERTIEALDAILGDDQLLRKVVSDELAEVAKTFGTPRRTVLLQSAGVTVSAAATSLEVADDPCLAYLSSSGLLARSSSDEPPTADGGRAGHDVIVSAVRTTARGEIGALTSRGRVVRLSVLDLPALPPSANHPNLQGGLPFDLVRSLDAGERVLALCALRTDGPGLALGTRQGVVKRVNPEVLGKDEWEVIGLKDGDEVIGAVELRTGDEELCFISSDAQLLHFGAAGVRPQGRSGGGMAGIKLAAGQHAVWFGALDPSASVVVTASGSSTALPGHRAGRGQGHAVRGVPRQGPGHRRRPLPPVPQGRGRPGVRLGGRGSRPRRGRQRLAGRPARADRAPRRQRYPGLPADRRLRRARARAAVTAAQGTCDRVLPMSVRRWSWLVVVLGVALGGHRLRLQVRLRPRRPGHGASRPRSRSSRTPPAWPSPSPPTTCPTVSKACRARPAPSPTRPPSTAPSPRSSPRARSRCRSRRWTARSTPRSRSPSAGPRSTRATTAHPTPRSCSAPTRGSPRSWPPRPT